MRYILAILFLLTALISEAQQRIVIENLAAVDSAWISGGNLFYRKNGSTFNAGSVGGTAPVTSVFGRTGVITAQSGDYASFYQPLNLKLTNFSDLVNGTGWLYNNGSGTYSWSNPFPSDTSLSINNRILSFSTPTLQSVTDNGFTTTNPLIANYFQVTPSAFSRFVGIDEGGTGALLNLLVRQNVGGSGYSANLRPDSLTNTGVPHNHYLPDTSGNYTVGVKVNGVTYMSRKNGITDLGTIGSSGFPSDTSLSINNRILSRFPSDTSLSINNRILARFPSDTSLSINNRFLDKVSRSEFLDSLDNFTTIEIDKTLDSLAWQKNDSTLKIKSVRVTAGSSKVSVTGSGTDSTRQWAVDINEANLTHNNIGGTLQTSKGGAPTGGSTGQVLKKNSNSDYDYSWANESGGGGGYPADTSTSLNNRILAVFPSDTSTSINNRINAKFPSDTSASINNRIEQRVPDGAGFPTITAEFLNVNAVQSEFIGFAIASGTNSTAAAAAITTNDHPGVVLIRSSTSANSGYGYTTSSTSNNAYMTLKGGETFDIVFRTPAAFTNTTVRFGYHTTSSSSIPLDGLWMEYIGSGAVVGRTGNAASYSTTPTIATLSANTWYHGRVTFSTNRATATFTLFAENGTQLGTADLTTNIPATDRQVRIGVVATNSGTTATDLLFIDFMRHRTTQKLNRGNF